MASKIRVLVPRGDPHVGIMASHVRGLQREGKHVLFITADRPYAVLQGAFRSVGVDEGRVFYLDTVSQLDASVPPERPENAHFLASPTMLEMVAMRAEQLATRLGDDVHVVLDSLNTLALYNGVAPVQEFAHYLANRLRMYGLDGDYVVRDNREGQQLREMVAGFTDSRFEAGAEGVAENPMAQEEVGA